MITLDNFEDAWRLLGNPTDVEENLVPLLKVAEVNSDKSIYPKLLCQIALAQAMQQKLVEAHATLDRTELVLTKTSYNEQSEVLLVRGKIFQQGSNLYDARRVFEQSYELALRHGSDFYAIDAAHMIAIISEDNSDKIRWNKRAIALANKTKDKKAHCWLGSLYNNLGQALLDSHLYQDALQAFTLALKYREEEGFEVNILVAKWAMACALRKLDRLEEALKIQLTLFDQIAESGKDTYPQVLAQMRGFICEELAELYYAISEMPRATHFAIIAIEDLSKSNDPLFRKSVKNRLNRLEEIRKT